MDFSSSNVHPQVESALHNLFKRNCVDCPGTTPSCPSCSGGKVCSLVPQSCDTCAYTTCVAGASGGSSSHSGPNVGAIAGGVVGGVVFIGLLVFLFYWFVIRARRQQYEDEWEEDEQTSDQKSHFNMQRSERASVHSVANSILSRASNFIPIAYIPGVMNRDGRTDSSSHVPPVPPIPAAHGQPVSSSSSNGEALFFRPGDLRDSTYSDTSSLDNRSTFFGRPSITPSLARSSVATFQDNAVANPMPAQTILRGKANVVSVKSSNTSSSSSTPYNATPSEELAAMDFGNNNGKKPNIIMPTSSDSVSNSSSSSQQTLSSASFGKPTLLTLTKKTKQKGRFPVRSPADSAGTANGKPNVSSPLANSEATSSDSEEDAGPFSDSASITELPPTNPNARPTGPSPARTPGGLSAVIEETATIRGSNASDYLTRDHSPFSDHHATS